MPTGGVSPTEENLRSWFEAGVTCVGMGSKLIRKNTDGTFDLPAIEKAVQNSLKIIQQLK
jgi:2-dehydro-3-deoxyphosphogluconate aldolase/(4S)-4-hydroxy-2-oxoglutarate aldolase